MFQCSVCNKEVYFWPLGPQEGLRVNSPMLTDDTWKTCLNYYKLRQQDFQFLCDSCMKKALGRNFKGKDFRDCIISWDYIKHNNLKLKIPKEKDNPPDRVVF